MPANQTPLLMHPAADTEINLPDSWRRKHLTSAEQKVIALVATGRAPKDVAMDLNRSISTIRNQLYTGMTKVGVRNRYELVARFAHGPRSGQPAPDGQHSILDYAI